MTLKFRVSFCHNLQSIQIISIWQSRLNSACHVL